MRSGARNVPYSNSAHLLPYLATRKKKWEREISDFVACGFTNKQIGEHLDISELTVKTHLRNVYSKTGVHDKAQLVSRILKSETDFWNVEFHKLMRRLHQAQDDKNKK